MPVQPTIKSREPMVDHSSLPQDTGAQEQQETKLLIKNGIIRRILDRVIWFSPRDDTKTEVAAFRGLDDAETKFQEFRAFIKKEGKNLGLPGGNKPFKRILIQSNPAGSPEPYILFTNFRSQEEVQRYHAALSKRKVRNQYHPPLRLCYELQELRFNAANANIRVIGYLGDTLCGHTAIIEDEGRRRLITIGGVIKVGGRLYAMTAGHSPNAGEDLGRSSEAESSTDNSLSFDASSFDDDIESALIIDEGSTGPKAEYPQIPGEQNKMTHDRTSGSAVAVTFQSPSIAGDDWALHLIEDPMLALPNSIPGDDDATESYMTYPAMKPIPGLVWLLAGVSGCRAVHMLPGTVTFPLPSGKWIDAWEVSRPFEIVALGVPLVTDWITRSHFDRLLWDIHRHPCNKVTLGLGL
ncbi:hypothetical protein N0V82_004906 [Gnomoniopsis sp. IMI 355080]|nr:hypothetical protein N0V82_004906 [Gnomoniopsis sp. IMI 355080]